MRKLERQFFLVLNSMKQKKWEYYSVVETDKAVNLSQILKPFGEKGWELVAYQSIRSSSNNPPQTVFIFKREKIKKDK